MRTNAARLTRVESDSSSMARESSTSVQVTLRIPKELVPLADEVAHLLSRPGLPTTRNDALRVSLARGLIVVAEELRRQGNVPAAEPSSPRPRKKR